MLAACGDQGWEQPRYRPRGGPWSGVGLGTPNYLPVQPALVSRMVLARHRGWGHSVGPRGYWWVWGVGT